MSTDTPTANSSDQTDDDQSDDGQVRDDTPPANFVFSEIGTGHRVTETYQS